jgi:hypothetical protein
MISRLVLSIGAVAASVGLTVYGMGTSYSPHNDDYKTRGLILMIGGVVAMLVGIGWYRKTEEAEVAEAVRKYGPDVQ